MLNGIVAAAFLALASPLPSPQSLPAVSVRAPDAVLELQVARTEAQRDRGLMSVRHLRPHSGMVFVFPSDDVVTFWMKNTLVPLDMVFTGSDGVVRAVFAHVPVVPLDTPDEQIPRRHARARYVLELPAGEAQRDGIHAGVRLGDLPAGTP